MRTKSEPKKKVEKETFDIAIEVENVSEKDSQKTRPEAPKPKVDSKVVSKAEPI